LTSAALWAWTCLTSAPWRGRGRGRLAPPC
jgi:hypothetical protein